MQQSLRHQQTAYKNFWEGRAKYPSFKRKNRRRDALDRLIAAHAISIGATLITNKEADFTDYPGLSVENWLNPPTNTLNDP